MMIDLIKLIIISHPSTHVFDLVLGDNYPPSFFVCVSVREAKGSQL